MGSAMGHLGKRPRNPPRSSAVARALASLCAAVTLAAPTTAQALPGSATTSATPTVAPPASAQVQPNASGTPAAPASGFAPQTATPGAGAAAAASALRHPRPSRAGKLSTPTAAIAVLAALLALGCAAWAIVRARVFEPRWMLSLRHAMAEGGFRASATWAEFSDWARLGR
jgi:hypothetical protein